MVRYPGPAPKLRLCAGIALYQAWEIILEGTFYSQGKQLQLMPVKDLHSWASLCSSQHAVLEFLGGRGDIRGPSSAKTLSLRLFLVNVQLHIRDVIPYRDMLTVPLMPFHPCRVWDCELRGKELEEHFISKKFSVCFKAEFTHPRMPLSQGHAISGLYRGGSSLWCRTGKWRPQRRKGA